MKTTHILIALLAGAAAWAQPAPVTHGALTVQLIVRHPAQEGGSIPLAPGDLGVDIYQVLVSTSTTTTALFRVTLDFKDGGVVTEMNQTVPRSVVMMSLAQFKVPIGSTLVGPLRIDEIASPEFIWIQL